MTHSSNSIPSTENDCRQFATITDDNDTSFEIDEPDDDELASEDTNNHYEKTPTNEDDINIASTSSGITSSYHYKRPSHVIHKDDSDNESNFTSGSRTCSSTPTTADVADITTATAVYPAIAKHIKRLTPAPHMQAITIQTVQIKGTTSEAVVADILPEDNCSDSLETTVTASDVELDNIATTTTNSNSARLTLLQSNVNAISLARTAAIPLLTHPSAACQQTDIIGAEKPTAGHHHKRTLSSASHRSAVSQFSAHTVNTSLSVQPKCKFWSCLQWICLCLKNSGIGEPSVHHALVVIFLEFFAWGLLTMPVIAVLNQTFPDHTFLMNGLVMGIKGILSFLSAPLIGALSDIWGRKFFLLITVFFTCAPIPLMTINTWWFFAMISISGIFAVTFSVVFAYVADVTTVEERSRAYGLVSATFAASLVISPALGAALMEKYSDTLVVALATAIAVLDVFFILVAVPESLPDKVRPSSWGTPINWEQADPFAALRKVGTDHTILMQCVTVLLSYLPEAGQYSCIFVYLKLKMSFNTMEVAIFIAVVGILSISVQVTLGYLMRRIGAKHTIILGLILEMTQLFWYGFGSQKWMMWAAGILAALGSITYPAISAFVSIHSTADSQGAVQGMVTGMRGLCNGLGPAMFGVIFYLFNVDLNDEHAAANNTAGSSTDGKWFQVPGPPFMFGGFMVILAILVALFIPEVRGEYSFNSRSPIEKKRVSLDVQYEIEGGPKPTSPLMHSDSLAQL
uniref:Major facilitator superfamily (MFS) profile domain-containing protein n=1 Tax=Glossina morsitans morsitans TaxID=37546 RepID=A0A1B0GCP9_GLOMM